MQSQRRAHNLDLRVVDSGDCCFSFPPDPGRYVRVDPAAGFTALAGILIRSAHWWEEGVRLTSRELWVGTYRVPGMDCPSEEQLIRLALDEMSEIQSLTCDFPTRQLQVLYAGDVAPITARLERLGLGASLIGTTPQIETSAPPRTDDSHAALRWVLVINFVMFLIELILGWRAQSIGLIADSFDMLADALVYGTALFAAGSSARRKSQAARLAGWLQAVLAIAALEEVVRRFVMGSEPEPLPMMWVSLLALSANSASLWLLARHRAGEVHMRASWIFTTNDVLANIGVIVAGGLVYWTQSRFPDLIVGLIIGLLVLYGCLRILRLKSELASSAEARTTF